MLINYSNKELDLCARLMRAEALSEGELAMLMVGNVIVNRAISNCLDFKNIRSSRVREYIKKGGSWEPLVPKECIDKINECLIKRNLHN